MDLTWPLVGRTVELEKVSAMLRGGQRAVLLAGEAGVGKTRLAGECLALAAEAGFVPLRIGGTQAASGLPFGAFASFVPEPTEGTERPELLRRIASSVVAHGEGSPVALFVDDVHLLDDSSAALTHLLAASEDPVFMLATLRSGDRGADSVVALWKDGLAERLELQPLGPQAIAHLLSLALAGPVDPATAHLLWQRTRGNALFLRELVLAGLESGVLQKCDGAWRITGELAFSARLLEIVDARLGDLGDDVRDALGLVAVGEPLGADVFRRIDDETDVEALERKGLVTVLRGVRRLDLRLAHPLYGEVMRSSMSPLRLRRLARAVADALLKTGARRREDVLRIATLRLDGGGSMSPELMLRAAIAARARFDLALAERLARAALDAGGGFDAGMLLGQLYWWQGQPADAERQLSSLLGAADDDARRARLATIRMEVLGFGLSRFSDGVRLADEAEATISDLTYRDQVTAYRARNLGWSGRYASAVEVCEPLLRRATGRTLIAASMAAATSMAICGRVTDAIAATSTGHAAHLSLTGPPLTFSPGFHLFLRAHALACAGRYAEAEALAAAQHAQAVDAGSLEGRVWFGFVLAAIYLGQGRLATATHTAKACTAEARQVNSRLMLRTPLIYLARTLAQRGDAAAARAALAELDALAVPDDSLFGPDLLRARAWLAISDGQLSDAYAQLQAAAAMARKDGADVFEAGALHDLARIGHAAQVAPRLTEVATRVEGPLWPVCVRHAVSLAEDDARGLVAASTAFEEEVGALLLAAEAAADSAVSWRRAHEPRKATAAERRSFELARRCEGARTPALLVSAPVRASLTPRELEIARLAASGLANREIAARLFLSHRTVENKLHSCYAKLGVAGRADLPRALADR